MDKSASETLKNKLDEEKTLLKASIRSRVKQKLLTLEEEVVKFIHDSTENNYKSWIGSTCTNLSQRCQFFNKNGFLLINSFVTSNDVTNMKLQMKNIVEEEWDPNQQQSVFVTGDKQIDQRSRDSYFLDSANNIHFFIESDAINNSNDDTTTGGLKAEFTEPNSKIGALNKVGHALHMIPGSTFKEYATSTKVKELVNELGWIDPVIPQSMYIFKQPKIGGEVTSHQDSTFLYTTPKQTCLGLWLALDDATIDNGCLWIRPGSHEESTRRKFARNPEYFGHDSSINNNNERGDLSKPMMIFIEECSTSEQKQWDGKIPYDGSCSMVSPWDSLLDVGFIPIECKAGDLVVFPGTLDHLSLSNCSDSQRHTFQLHLVEGQKSGIEWSKSNWLQYPKGVPFLSISLEGNDL